MQKASVVCLCDGVGKPTVKAKGTFCLPFNEVTHAILKKKPNN